MQKAPNRTIKTWNRQERTIKTVHFSMKEMEKPLIKGTGRTVKTAGQTGHTRIKTTEGTARMTQQGVRTAIHTTQRTTLAARKAVTAGVQGVKTAVKATATAAKVIIGATKSLVTAILAGGWIVLLLLLIVILFGAFFSIVGGSNSSTVTPMSAEVQAYEPLIRQYARQHGIEEYVELIKAVMMQESGGRGNDPMQASECGYNTRYPNTPNGITDPEYSIDVGIQNLAACLRAAEVESPVDMNPIKLALQGYNYGNGYILWAKEKDGGYTYANAVEFSTMMAERNGWSSYGDKEYVSHVLRYYVFGRIPTEGGNQAIVQVALTQEGNGGEVYWSWYGFLQRVEWCACFVSWCADQCGYIEVGAIPKFSLCSAGMEWFESRGQFRDGSYVPAAGDIVFFDWGNDGSIDHVGIVERVADGTIYTVEGNSGDQVAKRSYTLGYEQIEGFGIPAY
ncbi:lysozyme family protein [Blautia producta]|uniref:lysozyme family protein n=1 Tax=Blautia producta TaxID=33035 RepID=UPI0004961AF1